MKIDLPHIHKKYQVFISSTYKDLKDERGKIELSLRKNDYITIGMEIFPAANKSQWDLIKKRIDQSDFYILIIAGKYGTIFKTAFDFAPEIVEEDEEISFTHLEFRYAKEKGKPIFAFIPDPEVVFEKDKVESTIAGKKKLQRFVEETKNSKLTVKHWKEFSELAPDILAALTEEINSSKNAKNNNLGWVQTKELNEPISYGAGQVRIVEKTFKAKFVFLTKKDTSTKPVYKKKISRANTDIDVYDEYTAITVTHLNSIVSDFEIYLRTDGDGLEANSIFPQCALKNSDSQLQSNEKVIVSNIDVPSNVYVMQTSFYNGFQDGRTDLGVKVNKDTDRLRLVVDFSSIDNHENIIAGITRATITNTKKADYEEDILNYINYENGVFSVEKTNAFKEDKITIYFDINWDNVIKNTL